MNDKELLELLDQYLFHLQISAPDVYTHALEDAIAELERRVKEQN